MSAGISLATAATVAGIASSAVTIGSSLFGDSGGGGGGGGGNVAGGGYYDPYASERPKFFSGLQTLMGYGGTPGTPGSNNALSYADWVKANPTQAVGYGAKPMGGTVNLSNLSSYGTGITKAQSDKAYQDYITSQGGKAPTEGVSGNQAAINMVMNSPTYSGGLKLGLRTLSAGLARTGQVGSGAEQLALQGYGQDYFNSQYQNLYNQYTGLSKATDAPLNMANQNQLNYNANEANNTNFGQALGSLGQLGQQVSNLRANSTWMPSSFQDTSQPFTANWGNLDT